jgi:hypothetical protein
MLRTILTVVAVGIGGFALAFVVLFLGCDGPNPFFGVMCGHNILPSLVGLTIGAWFVLGSLAVLLRALRNKE